jgi:membrane-bound lytic murein transglycosylase B
LVRKLSRYLLLLTIGLYGFVISPSTAQEGVAAQASVVEPSLPKAWPNFQQCITGLQEKALEAGVNAQTAKGVLGNAKHLEKILSYDRNQPEFVQTFTGYFSKRVTDWRINKGREKLAKHEVFLKNLTHEYGVPAPYLVAFWGLETNFGTYKGKMPIIDSLATLACDQRRSEYFSGELIQALLLMDREKLNVDDMLGSWAGAMGHTQFMPTAYMLYARDGDKDGKIDLWNSELDALASAANFLNHLGWNSGFKWGREVGLPESFDYQLAGKDSTQTLAFWTKQGVNRASGKDLGIADIQASLLVPAGYQGPAFLVYKNFDVILRWNNSEYYGIAVGHLADRIANKATLTKALPELPNYTLAEMQLLQSKLNELGFDVGKADGILGPATRKGLRGFQTLKGVIADGYPSREVFELLMTHQA